MVRNFIECSHRNAFYAKQHEQKLDRVLLYGKWVNKLMRPSLKASSTITSNIHKTLVENLPRKMFMHLFIDELFDKTFTF